MKRLDEINLHKFSGPKGIFFPEGCPLTEGSTVIALHKGIQIKLICTHIGFITYSDTRRTVVTCKVLLSPFAISENFLMGSV